MIFSVLTFVLFVNIASPEFYEKNYSECVDLYYPERLATDYKGGVELHLLEVKWR